MKHEGWLRVLEQQAEARGNLAVARELGVSPATISLVRTGKYPASPAKVAARVEKIYGDTGMVSCPVLGEIKPGVCVENWEKAKKVGLRSSNPRTLRLYQRCAACDLRG